MSRFGKSIETQKIQYWFQGAGGKWSGEVEGTTHRYRVLMGDGKNVLELGSKNELSTLKE